MPNNKKKYPCIECKENVEESQHSVQCTICSRWIHKDCGVGDKLYNLILEISESIGRHCWSCEGCGIGLSKMNKMVQNHDREIRELRKDVDELKKQKPDTENLDNRITALATDVANLKTQPKSDNEIVFEELSLRESKRSNIMVFGIKDPNSELGDNAKKKVDEDSVLELLQELGFKLKMKEDIKFLSRVGKASAKKPIVVGFRSQVVRDKILNSAYKLGESTFFKDVSISPDLTTRQLEEDKRVSREAEAKNKEMMENESNEAKNFIWKAVGQRGQRYLKKVALTNAEKEKSKKIPPLRLRIPSHKRKAEMENEEEEVEVVEELPQSQQRKKSHKQY